MIKPFQLAAWAMVSAFAVIAGCGQSDDSAPAAASRAPAATHAPSPDVVDITLVYGSEKQTWIDDVTASFNASATKIESGKVVRVTTTPMGSGESKDDLLAGRIQGHLWSPASGAFVKLANAESQTKGTPLVGPTKELVLSPVVIAMWKPMAESLGWPNKPIGWADVIALAKNPDGWGAYGHKEFGRFKFGHTHPEYSNSGLISILAEAYAGAGKARDLSLDDLNDPKVGAYLSEVEQSIVHYGRSTGFFGKRLADDGPGYLSAAVVYESTVIESYAKNLSTPLVAIYPKEGTFWSDHPIGIVQRPWVSDEQKQAAQKYIDYLRAPAQQAKAVQYGFRPAEGEVAAPIDLAHGVDPKQPQTVLDLPSAAVVNATIQLWRKNKRHTDVALVFDKSGSMNDENKIVSAKRGAVELVNLLNPQDTLTLIPFSSDVAVLQRVRIDVGREDAVSRINGLIAEGSTHLYDSVLTARRELMSKSDKTRIQAIVVLTDGEDSGKSTTIEQVLDQITDLEAPENGVRIFTIGYGKSAKLDDLKKIAKRTHGEFYQGKPENILNVFRDIATFF